MKTEGKMNVRSIEWIAMVLVIIGAINWGLVGIAGFVGGNLNLVNLLLGSVPAIESLVYLVVGLAGLYLAYFGYQLFGAQSEERFEAVEPKGTAK